MANRPKWNRRKGYPTQEPYEALDALIVLVAAALIYDAETMEERIIRRCQEPLDMRGATPEERRQITKALLRMKRQTRK